MTSNKPAMWWILTIPKDKWEPELHENVKYIKGQLEVGESGFEHWQVVCCLKTKQRMTGAKKSFPNESHLEPTRSEAALEYVWKEETAVEGSRFELGVKPMKRNVPTDWDLVKENAKQGKLEEIPSDVYVRCYSTLRRIEKDYMKPEVCERKVVLFYGKTDTGKSHRAWELAGTDVGYAKLPNTKFWDGYNGQESVVIEEFRGLVDISHVLRWFDKWPCIVENKGGATTLRAKRIYVTSNLHPINWYPNLDADTYAALLRRLEIVVVTKKECDE